LGLEASYGQITFEMLSQKRKKKNYHKNGVVEWPTEEKKKKKKEMENAGNVAFGSFHLKPKGG
jgi:hypothetical protein